MTATAITAHQPDQIQNEVEHYCQAERWLARAEAAHAVDPDDQDVDTSLRFAAVHAALATAADVDRGATAEQRVAECVPEGGSKFGVAVAR